MFGHREQSQSYETSGLGEAIDAAVGSSLHPEFDTALQAITRYPHLP